MRTTLFPPLCSRELLIEKVFKSNILGDHLHLGNLNFIDPDNLAVRDVLQTLVPLQ